MGLNVQGWIADDPDQASDSGDFEPVVCLACTRTHFVNLKTGKVLGKEDE